VVVSLRPVFSVFLFVFACFFLFFLSHLCLVWGAVPRPVARSVSGAFLWWCPVVSLPRFPSALSLAPVVAGGAFSSVFGRCRAAPWRSVVGSALRFGAVAWSVRPSPRSFSGFVLVAVFPSAVAAAPFAGAGAAFVGRALALRPVSPFGVLPFVPGSPAAVAVSVPVSAWAVPAVSAPVLSPRVWSGVARPLPFAGARPSSFAG
jgi:hypothetical protein